MSKRIAIVGPGVMGSLLQTILQAAHHITMISRDQFSQTNWSNFEVICLAIKPQDFKNITQLAATHALIISVMTGITTSTLSRVTTSQRIIRTMPNTPLQVGVGMTAWCKTTGVSAADITWFQQVFASRTTLLDVGDDNGINKATAVSASGPAYVFLFAEQLMHAASAIGFTTEQARLLVSQTILGAGHLLAQRGESPAELRQQVTSKGGTTAAALASLDQPSLQLQWDQAVAAAYQRANELSQ